MAKQKKTKATTLKIKEVTQKIEEGLADFIKSGKYADMLKGMSNLGKYSLNNQIWLFIQMPTVHKVATFNSWKSEGVKILEGSKSLKLLAPIVINEEKTNETTGETTTKEAVVAFRTIPVFDISQTDAKPVEDPKLPDGIVPDYQKKIGGLTKLAKDTGYQVFFDTDASDKHGEGCHGYCDHLQKVIHVNPGSQLAVFSVLCHEVGHMLAHSKERSDFKGLTFADLKGIKELEAQSIAAIVTQSCGLSTDLWDFSYITGWASKMAASKFRKNLEMISKCAQAELEAIK